MADKQENDNKVNGNVHPNSRAARGDAEIEKERAARDAAAPAATSEDQINGGDKDARIQELENEVADLKGQVEDLEDAAETTAEDHKSELEKAQAGHTEASDKSAKDLEAANDRADKAEARVKELEAAAADADKPKTDTATGDGSGNGQAPAAPASGTDTTPTPPAN